MKHLLSVIFLLVFLCNSFATSALAQTPLPQPQSSIPLRTNNDVPSDLGTHTQVVLIEVMAALTCQLAGVDPVNPERKCLGVDSQTGKIGFVENGGGAIGVVSSLIAGTFDIPVSSSQYVRYVASNFGITKGAYAQQQGAGFSSLHPLQNTWVQFRNVVYILFVVFFMLIGFAIIFRFKVDQRTVMTIQNAIPRAIITLLLVTFSFAIVGFMIDIMYLTMYLFYELIAGIKGVNVAGLNPTNLVGSTPFGATGPLGGIHGLAWDASGNISGIISSIFDGSAGRIIAGIIFSIIGVGAGALTGGLAPVLAPVFGGILGGIGLATGSSALGFIGGFIAFFILLVAILFALFRLWFTLLKAYLFILIDTVVAPVWIAGSLIPGSPLSAGSWFRHLFKYIAVFPLTLFMFLLGSVFVQIFASTDPNTPYFTPPFIGSPINPKNFGALIGLAIILMTPEVVNMLQDILKSPQNPYQRSIGAAFSMGTNVVSKPAGAITKRAWSYDDQGRPVGWVGSRISERLDPRVRAGGRLARLGRSLLYRVGTRSEGSGTGTTTSSGTGTGSGTGSS